MAGEFNINPEQIVWDPTPRRVKPNPYPPGTEKWHDFNLHGGSWGHTEESYTDDRGFYLKGIAYGPDTFELSHEDLVRGLAIELDIPPELICSDAECCPLKEVLNDNE